MKPGLLRSASLCILICFVASCKHEPLYTPSQTPVTESTTCSPDTVYFRQQVLPIFISNCTQSGCHDGGSRKEGVILDSYDNIMNTGKIRPFQPFSSKAYKKIIETNSGDRMPPGGSLTQSQKDIIYKWIMQGALNNSCSNNCDSSVFTFAVIIKPLISLKCQGCHSGGTPQGGIDLSTYVTIKMRVDDGKLWGSINHKPGFQAMPKNGQKLSECELKQFERWIADGALNN